MESSRKDAKSQSFAKLFALALLSLAALLAASRLEGRDLPPLVPPPAPISVPTPAVRSLANGLKVVLLESHALPVVTLTLAVKTGAEADPPGFPGTAELVASMLNEGTKSRSAQQIAEAVDDMGAVFDSAADWDDSWASLSVLSNHAPLAFDLLADMAVHPAFAPADVERARRQALSALSILRHDPGYLADTLIQRMVFAGTPYSHPSDGIDESVSRLNAEDLRRFHDRYYQPSNAVLVVVGDVSSGVAFELAESWLGSWKGIEPLPAAVSEPRAPSHLPRVVVIDDPDAVETDIRVGNPAVRRDSPSYDALTIANQILGGPAENALFSALRTRRGLVYGASSRLVSYRGAGAWEIKTSTRTAATGKTVRLILDEMNRLHSHAIRSVELQNAQDYLVGHMALDFETSQQIAQHILNLMVYNLPMDTWNRKAQEIRGLSAEAVWSATRRYLDPEKAVIVLVGNAAGFRADLKDLGPARIIPVSAVDFSSATLERPVTMAAGSH